LDLRIVEPADQLGGPIARIAGGHDELVADGEDRGDRFDDRVVQLDGVSHKREAANAHRGRVYATHPSGSITGDALSREAHRRTCAWLPNRSPRRCATCWWYAPITSGTCC